MRLLTRGVLLFMKEKMKQKKEGEKMSDCTVGEGGGAP